MIVEVIAVGTELLLGQIVNGNAAAIGSRLAEEGFDAHYQVVVGDNEDRLVACSAGGGRASRCRDRDRRDRPHPGRPDQGSYLPLRPGGVWSSHRNMPKPCEPGGRLRAG